MCISIGKEVITNYVRPLKKHRLAYMLERLMYACCRFVTRALRIRASLARVMRT